MPSRREETLRFQTSLGLGYGFPRGHCERGRVYELCDFPHELVPASVFGELGSAVFEVGWGLEAPKFHVFADYVERHLRQQLERLPLLEQFGICFHVFENPLHTGHEFRLFLRLNHVRNLYNDGQSALTFCLSYFLRRNVS